MGIAETLKKISWGDSLFGVVFKSFWECVVQMKNWWGKHSEETKLHTNNVYKRMSHGHMKQHKSQTGSWLRDLGRPKRQPSVFNTESTRGFESVGIRLLVSCLLSWQNTKQKPPKGGMIYSSSWFRSYSSKGQGRQAIGLSHRRSDKCTACSEIQTARRTGARLQRSKPTLLATYLR